MAGTTGGDERGGEGIEGGNWTEGDMGRHSRVDRPGRSRGEGGVGARKEIGHAGGARCASAGGDTLA